MSRFVVVLCLLALIGSGGGAQAQTPPPKRLVAVRLPADGRYVLDGRLTEAVWSQAQPATDFSEQDPVNGEPASEATEVRVVYDTGRLIIGVTCFDSEPTRLLGNQMQRDQGLASDDRFMVSLDTYADGRTGYYFEINPSGAMGDGLIVPGTGITINRAWDGIWNARVARDERGWTAEIEIPFRTLSFDPHAASWGINFQRTIKRKAEETLWTGWARNQGLTYMVAAGRLEGLQDLDKGVGLDLLPYVLGSAASAPGRGQPDAIPQGTYGGDVVYSITQGLRANLSVNTDFAETEVDQRQVNLTRFPLFFPEKRAFFLEGGSVFNFSREPGNALVPFFSRRIGLDEAGVPQPVAYGAKVTGQIGRFDLGVVQVRTRESGRAPAENFGVVRVQRRFWRQSSVGGILTTRDAASTTSRQTVGLDAVLSTAQFLGHQVLEVSGFYLSTTKRPGTQGGAAYGGRINLPNDPINARLSIREVQDGYDPAVGFVDRRGYRLVNPAVRYTVHTNRSRITRRFSIEGDFSYYFDLTGQLESRKGDIQVFRTELQTSDIAEFHVLPLYERLPRPFQIAPGVTLPAGGAYSFLRRHYQLTSATNRPASLNVTYEDGEFYSGTRRQVTGTLSVRPYKGWLVSAGGDFNEVSLREGRFTTRVWTSDVNTQFSPFLSLVNRIQFDSVTRQLGWQSRFRWITRPGNDVFVVYTRNWTDRTTLQTLDQKGTIKIVRTIRF